jgi:hypothetical protein
MPRALWQLLLEDPSDLNCDECFAVMEYYAEVLARGGVDLLPEIIDHLERCPDCRLQYRAALLRLISTQSERDAGPLTGVIGVGGSNATGQRQQSQGRQKSPE